MIPRAVSTEILAGPEQNPAKVWIQSKQVVQRIANEIPISHSISAWDLGAGETAVIALASKRPQDICVIDDLAARNGAQTFSLPILGTLGVLLKAKAAGIVSELNISSLLARYLLH